MATSIQQNTQLTFGVILFASGTTTELTGVVSSAVNMYVWNAGNNTYTNVPNTGTNSFTWAEKSSTYMPGLYSVVLPAIYTNVPIGELIIYTSSAASSISKRDFVVTQNTIDTIGWNVPIVGNSNLGTMGGAMRLLYQDIHGRTQINTANKTYVIYAEDGVTPLCTSSLLDQNGNPTSMGAYQKLQGIP
jgi:hypothetical protein